MRPWLKRALAAASVTSLLGVGLVGFAHTKAGRPLLGWLKGAPGCPVLEGKADPAAIEAYRTRTLRTNLAEASHEARLTPALSFSLGKSTRADVSRFASRHGASCNDEANGAALRCTGFGDSTELSDLYAQFDLQGHLVALDGFSDLNAEAGLDYLKQREQALVASVGPVTKTTGVAPVTKELQAPYARSGIEFEYKRYSAKLSIMNFGKRGTRVREQYQWLAPAELAAR